MRPTIVALCAMTFALAACSSPEPEPVYMQPSFDKAGNAHCDGGYALVTTDSGQPACAPAS